MTCSIVPRKGSSRSDRGVGPSPWTWRPLAQHPLQRSPVHAELLRGSGHVAAALLEYALDVFPADPVDAEGCVGYRNQGGAAPEQGIHHTVGIRRLGQVVVEPPDGEGEERSPFQPRSALVFEGL